MSGAPGAPPGISGMHAGAEAANTKRLIEEMLQMQGAAGIAPQAAAAKAAGMSPQQRAQYQQMQMASMLGAAAAGNPTAAPAQRPAPPNVSGDVHHDIARDIGQQVEMMILNAKRTSEVKVSNEIQKIKQKMTGMEEKIKKITERVNHLDPTNGSILKSDLQKSIEKLEDVWDSEVSTLKHELWQTIQAHNHNADLMKHHKDAIDSIQGRMAKVQPSAEMEQVHSQLVQVDKIMQREQAKQQQMEQLHQRLTVVQQQLAMGGAFPGGNMPFPMPSMSASAALPGQMAAAKKAQRKGAKAARTPKAPSAASGSLRAEAPEFVPTWGSGDV